MRLMPLTLDVSKLSGWLNAAAPCRVGRRARAERTVNMRYIFVTLDVSKLSGWLNADANCRVGARACDVGRGAGRETGGPGVAAAQQAAYTLRAWRCGGASSMHVWGGSD